MISGFKTWTVNFKPIGLDRVPCTCRVSFNVLSYTIPAEATRQSRPLRPKAKRGRVLSFSRRSRLRLLRFLNEIRYDLEGVPFFVTLTFHRRPRDPYSKFHALRQWMHRRKMKAVWKLEIQRRGVEHFHLLVWGDRRQVEEIKEYWHSIASEGSFRHKDYGTRIDEVSGGVAAMLAYVGKYVGKDDNLGKGAISERLEGHRYWGIVGKINRDPFDQRRLARGQAYLMRRVVRRIKKARARRIGARKRPRWEGLRGDWILISFEQGLKLIWWILEHGRYKESVRGSPGGGRSLPSKGAASVGSCVGDGLPGPAWVF